MDHFVVSSRDGFAAAILAAAQPTFEDAKAHPFIVDLADTKLRFTAREGVTDRRAEKLARAIRKSPAKNFQPHQPA